MQDLQSVFNNTMAAYKNVAIFGATGNLGSPVFNALVDSGKFGVTVITRKESSSTFLSNVKVVKVDYSSVDELTGALQGHDAVVSAVGAPGTLGQKAFIDAAIAAGVSRFLPAEFGSDLTQPKIGSLPVFAHKKQIREYLEEKIASGANITYTYVVTSGFLDWGLDKSLIINWRDGKPEVYDSGDQPVSLALLSDIGKSVVGVLTHPEETKNRQVVVSSVVTSQNKLLALAKEANPEKVGKWESVHVKFSDVEKSNAEAIEKGDYSFPIMLEQLKFTMFGGAAYGQPLKDNNEILGVKGNLSDDDLVELWKKMLA